MNAIFGDLLYRQFILNMSNWSWLEFWEFVFHISSRTDFIYGKPIWALVG